MALGPGFGFRVSSILGFDVVDVLGDREGCDVLAYGRGDRAVVAPV